MMFKVLFVMRAADKTQTTSNNLMSRKQWCLYTYQLMHALMCKQREETSC